MEKELGKSVIKKIERPPRSLYPVMAVVVFSLMAIEMPYRSIHIPEPIMVAFGLIFFIGIVFLSFENFFLVIMILVAYLPFSSILPGDFGGFVTAFNLTNILTLVIVVGWVARGSFRGESIYHKTRVDWLLFVFCLLASVSLVRGTIMGAVSEHILFSLKRYLTPFFFFYVFANNIRTRKEIEYILVTVAFVATCVAIMTLKESYIDIGSFGNWDNMRAGSITQQPNDLAAFFSYYMPFLLVPLLHQMKRFRYWILLFFVFLCFWATTRTFSRGGMIAFVISFLVTVAITHRKLALVILIAIIVTVVQFPYLLPESVIGRFATTFQPGSTTTVINIGGEKFEVINPNRLDKSALRRLEIWNRAIPFVKDNPFLGIGYGRFSIIVKGDAHNGFILIGTEMGLLALITYLLILWRLAVAARYIYIYTPNPLLRWLGHAYLAAIIAVIVANQFGSRLNSQELSSLFWIVGGIVMGVERSMKTRTDEEFVTLKAEPELPKRVSGKVPIQVIKPKNTIQNQNRS